MARVVCENIGPRLRDTERSVAIRDVHNHLHYLTVEPHVFSCPGSAVQGWPGERHGV